MGCRIAELREVEKVEQAVRRDFTVLRGLPLAAAVYSQC